MNYILLLKKYRPLGFGRVNGFRDHMLFGGDLQKLTINLKNEGEARAGK
jgi:hypothetical protein